MRAYKTYLTCSQTGGVSLFFFNKFDNKPMMSPYFAGLNFTVDLPDFRYFQVFRSINFIAHKTKNRFDQT